MREPALRVREVEAVATYAAGSRRVSRMDAPSGRLHVDHCTERVECNDLVLSFKPVSSSHPRDIVGRDNIALLSIKQPLSCPAATPPAPATPEWLPTSTFCPKVAQDGCRLHLRDRLPEPASQQRAGSPAAEEIAAPGRRTTAAKTILTAIVWGPQDSTCHGSSASAVRQLPGPGPIARCEEREGPVIGDLVIQEPAGRVRQQYVSSQVGDRDEDRGSAIQGLAVACGCGPATRRRPGGQPCRT